MAPRPTQKQVAQKAGVSQTVVSQVLNGQADQARINPETRARVQEAIQELGYVPNVAARRLVGGSSSLIGVFTYEAVFPSSTRDFYAPFLEGIEEAASEQGLDLLLYTSGTEKSRRSLASTVARRSLTDGTILLGNPSEQERAELASVVRSGHQVVFVGRRELPEMAVPCVQADYLTATAELTQCFINFGHQALLYVGGRQESESAVDRERGFFLAEGAIQRKVERLAVHEVTAAWLKDRLTDGTTGFLMENDALMRRLLKGAESSGLHCPQHFSACVLGDAISGEPAEPQWTRFRIPRKDMGRGAIQLLAGGHAGKEHPDFILPCEIVSGQTVSKVRPLAIIQ